MSGCVPGADPITFHPNDSKHENMKEKTLKDLFKTILSQTVQENRLSRQNIPGAKLLGEPKTQSVSKV